MLQQFQILIDSLTGIGFGMLAAAGQISAPVCLLFLVFFVPLFHLRLRNRFQLEQWRGNLLTWIYVPVFVLDIFLFSRSFVPATLHLILFVQLVKSYQPLQDRDHVYLIILSFLQVLAASSLTIDVSFLILFAIYLLVCLAALMMFEMKRAVARACLHESAAARPNAPQPSAGGLGVLSKAQSGRVARSLALVSGASLLAIAVLGTALFFAIPRFGSGYFHRAARSSSLSGFSDNIRLGGIGTIQLDPAVVMRVRVKGDPGLLKKAKWRGVTLDYFDGRSWSKRARGAPVNYSPGRDFRIQEPSGSGATIPYQVWLEPSGTSYLFTVAQVLHLKGQLDPLSRDPADDSFTARPHTSRRLAYDAVSRLPRLGEPSQGADMLLAERQAYLQLPTLDPRLFDLALSISAGATSHQEKAHRIEKHLQANYHYTLDQDQLDNPQALASFLLQSRRGHCEYFASSMVVLLRALRIPARIVNGFQAGEYNEIGENYVIRGQDAHSWTEVWIQGSGWTSFDPTPASSEPFLRSPLAAVLGNYLDAFELFWAEWVVGYDDVIQVALFRDLQDKAARLTWMGQQRLYRSAIGLQLKLQAAMASAIGGARNSPKSVLLYAAVAGCAAGIVIIIGRQARKKLWLNRSMRASPARLAARFYGEFLALAAAHGKPKPAASTPGEFAATFRAGSLHRQVQELTGIYHLMRFSPQPAREEQIRRAGDLLREMRLHARKRKALS